jgi:hypothetical protein
MRALAALALLTAAAWAWSPPAAAAQEASPSPPPPASPDPVQGATNDTDAGAAAGAGAGEAQSAAALRATQDLEARVVELQRQMDAMERERAAFDDVRRRLDLLEAREAALTQAQRGDWTSVPMADGVRVTPGGLVFRSPGNRFLLRPGLRLQGLYEADLATTGSADAARPNSSAFALTHAELLFEGHVFGPRLEYRFELDFAETLPQIAKDAFMQWRFGRSVALRFGQFKVPYGLETQYWNALLEFVDVSQATAAFTLGRDVGLEVVGRPLAGRLQYQVAAFNGPRSPCPRNLDGLGCDQVDLAYAARVVAAPFGPLPAHEGDLEGEARPLLSVGVSGAYLLLPTDVRVRSNVPNAPLDVDQNGRIDNVGVLQGAVELRALWRGASIQAEWFGRREDPGAGAPDRSYFGAYGQAGYFVIAHDLQLVARVGRTDLPLYGITAAERLLRGTQRTEEVGGINAYLRGHDLKLQVDYTHSTSPDAQSAPTVHRIRAAVQMAF